MENLFRKIVRPATDPFLRRARLYSHSIFILLLVCFLSVSSPLAAAQSHSSYPSRPRISYNRRPHTCQQCGWSVFPSGLLYAEYLADPLAQRMAGKIGHDNSRGWVLDANIGGRLPLLRNGSGGEIYPNGYQFDIGASSMLRLDYSVDDWGRFVTADYRFDALLTSRYRNLEWKFGYAHLSSHLGDEEMIANNSLSRRNYVRDEIVLGLAWRFGDIFLSYPVNSLRIYTEAGYAFHYDGSAKAWQLKFGLDYAPFQPTDSRGAPFFAAFCHLREENNFGGYVALQIGWAWRNERMQLLRIALDYTGGKSKYGQFFDTNSQDLGVSLLVDL